MAEKPRILLYDLEISPSLAWVYQHYEASVLGYERHWEILSVAFKWLGIPGVQCFSRRSNSEKELVMALHGLFDEADFLIAHNGDDFDYKKTNAKFLEFGLRPPSPVMCIDTKKLAKKYFKFNSNKLDDLCEKLNLGRKVATNFELWLGCIRGESESFLKMEKYNKQDVILLEKLYLKLRPWIKNQPGISVAQEKKQCPNCGSWKLIKQGIRKRAGSAKQAWQCNDCGGWCTTSVALEDRA